MCIKILDKAVSDWSVSRVPTLPSGISFALGHIREASVFADAKNLTRRHVINSAKEIQDLYPALPVIEFGQRANASGSLARVPIPKDLPPDTCAFYSGVSLLEFFESLSSEDKKATCDWLAEKGTVHFLSKQLGWTFNERRRSGSADQMLYSDRAGSHSTGVLKIYRPQDLAISAVSLFPDSASDWKPYTSEAGFLRLRPSLVAGISGAQGLLALANPPSLKKIDAWEASKASGVWDYWSFLAYVVVPSVESPDSELVLFFEQNTFFDRPREVLARIPLNWCDDSGGCDDCDELERQWSRIVEALSIRFRCAAVDEQTWTIDGVRFDAKTPDE